MLPEPQQRKVRTLLRYNPETAGGLMSPDFLSLPATTPVAEVLRAIRSSPAPPEALNVVFATGPDGTVAGSASAVRLIKAPPEATLGSIMQANPVHIHPDWDVHSTIRQMSDFNLTVAPVMDEEHGRMLGVVTVDDVLELVMPNGWRREYGMTSAPEG